MERKKWGSAYYLQRCYLGGKSMGDTDWTVVRSHDIGMNCRVGNVVVGSWRLESESIRQ